MSKFRNKNLKARYNITEEDYQQLSKQQNHRCAICSRKLPQLYVDHDHKNSLIRGLLCNACNVGLGMFKESTYYLLSACEYLIKPIKNYDKDSSKVQILR